MNFKVKKILIIGINNEFAINLLNSIDYKTIDVYGFDLYYNTKFRRKYRKIYFPKNNDLTTIFDFLVKQKYDIIYLFDYFVLDIFFLNEENSKILYEKLRFLINKIIKPKRFIFISNTNPIKLLLKKDLKENLKNLNFEELKYKYSFLLENLIKRAHPQNWKILRFHNLFSQKYYNHYIHQLIFNAIKIKKSKTKAGSLYVPNEFVTSFVHIDDALIILKEIEKIKETGVFIISNPEKVNTRDLYQYIICKFDINPKYIINKNFENSFLIESSKNLELINFKFKNNFYNIIYKFYISIINKHSEDAYLIENIYKNINLK